LGVGLTTAPCKTWVCLETSTEASEEEEGWGSHGPKRGRSGIEVDNRYKRGRKRRKYLNEEYGRRRKGERRRR
jgi:hypothetical protein